MNEDEDPEIPLVGEDEWFKYYEGTVNGRTIRFTENKLDPETKVPKKIQRALLRAISEKPA